jgi:hypothetical protein
MRNCVAVLKLKTVSTVEFGPTIIRVSRRVSSRQIRARRRRGIPHPGEVRHRTQGSGGAFVELSRTPAMRIVTAVTRPTIVASPG